MTSLMRCDRCSKLLEGNGAPKDFCHCPKPHRASDAVDRLEKWKRGHKRRSVEIWIDDGYGATCWQVNLHGVLVSQADTPIDSTTVSAYDFGGDPKRPEPTPFDVQVWDNEKDDWAGLAAVIHGAIDRAEMLESSGLGAVLIAQRLREGEEYP